MTPDTPAALDPSVASPGDPHVTMLLFAELAAAQAMFLAALGRINDTALAAGLPAMPVLASTFGHIRAGVASAVEAAVASAACAGMADRARGVDPGREVTKLALALPAALDPGPRGAIVDAFREGIAPAARG